MDNKLKKFSLLEESPTPILSDSTELHNGEPIKTITIDGITYELKFLRNAYDQIDEPQSTQKQQPNVSSEWISVEDHLPEFCKDVIIVLNDNTILMGRCEGGQWYAYWFDKGYDIISKTIIPSSAIRNVTHWMPLPKPPSETKSVENSPELELSEKAHDITIEQLVRTQHERNKWKELCEKLLLKMDSAEWQSPMQEEARKLLSEPQSEQSNESEDEFEMLFKDFINFSIPTFKNASALSSLEKLSEEMQEVATEIQHGHLPKDLKKEFVDCFMCLLDSQARANISIKEFKQAFKEKLAENKNRKWVKNSNNTYSHQ